MFAKYLVLAATAVAAISSTAQARDGSPYVGIEGGVIKPKNVKLDFSQGPLAVDNGIILDHKTGLDADLIAGYDLGIIRIEGELGYKRASLDDVVIAPAVLATTGPATVDGRTRVLSAMANLLLDFGGNDGLGVYAGGGIGAARIDVDSTLSGPGIPVASGINGDDRSLAWQLIAGVRVPVGPSVDLGLKYRYFNADLEFNDTSGRLAEGLDGKFRSHSLLASLIFNFGGAVAPAPAPLPVEVAAPPPPPPPATQTCADGSVILATDVCPTPPPPPPPPVVTPERG